MIYLSFIEPAKVVVPVLREAEIGRLREKVVVKTNYGLNEIGFDMTVSRAHARIYAESGKYYIQDLGSLNGTRINGKIIDGWLYKAKSLPAEIADGSIVEIGMQTLMIIRSEKEDKRTGEESYILFLLQKYLDDAIKVLLDFKYKKEEKDFKKFFDILKFIHMKKTFLKLMDEVSKESSEVLREHIQLIEDDYKFYLNSKKSIELMNLLELLKSNIEIERIREKVSKPKISMEELERKYIEAICSLLINCARIGRRVEVMRYLEEIKKYSKGRLKDEIDNAIGELELMIKNGVEINENFIEKLEVLANRIKIASL